MKKAGYLLIILVVATAFWQLFFLQNGMKWDFVDAFLPSRYFFSESVLNNQFPLWNPYLLYGTPIYADLVSVFSPEFWIVGNLFGYSNITLQFVFLAYIFIAGVSFFYFLKQFNAEKGFATGLSVTYMLSGFVVGNSQHIAFICGYALLPFLMAAYFRFLRKLNKSNLVRIMIALFLMVYCSYPALTVIAGYFMVCIFLYFILIRRSEKGYLSKLLINHVLVAVVVILFSAPLILSYFQISPFLSRFNGLPPELALKHPFSVRSLLSFILPMAVGNDPIYFGTDVSFSNGYFGIFGLIMLLFALSKKVIYKESYVILFFAVLSLFASFGDHFFVREILYNYVPLMDRFQYPGIFRAFTIFGFLAFAGINVKVKIFTNADRKRLMIISGLVVLGLIFLVFKAFSHIEKFVYFDKGLSFYEELFKATRFDNIIFQGVIQIFILLLFIVLTWKIKRAKRFSLALLLLFIADGIISVQLSANYTVLSKTDPVKFYRFLRSSPKGFPVPDLNPIGENTDRNAFNEFTWMNNNVFPKKVTFDGLVSFKMDGYRILSDSFPDLLEAIKKEPVVYFSNDVRSDSDIRDFNPNTVFLNASDYKRTVGAGIHSGGKNKLEISGFSPSKIEIKTDTEYSCILVYQQNYFTGWKVFIDGVEKDLLKSNLTHMAVVVPPGIHAVSFQYSNQAVIYFYCFAIFIFLTLVGFSLKYYVKRNPTKKSKVFIILGSFVVLLLAGSLLNRYFYNKNRLGLTPVIAEKVEKWKSEYKNDIRILLSTSQMDIKNIVNADSTCFINENNNVVALSDFLMGSESKYFVFAWQGGIIGDDLFELMYSFYPTIIEQEKGNNSGYVLLEKSGNEPIYKFEKTFEPESTQEWHQDSARIQKDTVTGNQTYFYTENEEFGTSVEFTATRDLIAEEKITVLVDFKIDEKLEEVLLVFTTARIGEMKIYKTLNIANFAIKPGKWERAVIETRIKPDIEEGDVIKIYFWNLKKAKFEIDNLRVKY